MSEKSVNINSQDSVTLSVVEQPTGPNIKVRYHTLNGNTPNKNGNYIGLWQSSNGIIPKDKAIWSFPLNKDSSESTITLMNTPINDDSYILGYCQTGDPKQDLSSATNASASAVITPVNFAVIGAMTLDITGGSSDALLTYKILKGTNYSSHWFGIWKEDTSIDTDKPIYSKKVSVCDPEKTGNINLDEVAFQRGTTYNLAYFANGFETLKVANMVSIINFTL